MAPFVVYICRPLLRLGLQFILEMQFSTFILSCTNYYNTFGVRANKLTSSNYKRGNRLTTHFILLFMRVLAQIECIIDCKNNVTYSSITWIELGRTLSAPLAKLISQCFVCY